MIGNIIWTVVNVTILIGAWVFMRFANRVLDAAIEANKEAKAYARDADVAFNRSQVLRDEARRYYERIEEARS